MCVCQHHLNDVFLLGIPYPLPWPPSIHCLSSRPSVIETASTGPGLGAEPGDPRMAAYVKAGDAPSHKRPEVKKGRGGGAV